MSPQQLCIGKLAISSLQFTVKVKEKHLQNKTFTSNQPCKSVSREDMLKVLGILVWLVDLCDLASKYHPGILKKEKKEQMLARSCCTAAAAYFRCSTGVVWNWSLTAKKTFPFDSASPFIGRLTFEQVTVYNKWNIS